jgi:hypothetical protein
VIVDLRSLIIFRSLSKSISFDIVSPCVQYFLVDKDLFSI